MDRVSGDQANFFKSYAELSRLALVRGRDREYRVWLLARHLDRDGQGWVEWRALRGAFRELTGQTERQYRRIMARGGGLFWTRVGSRLELHGLRRLAWALGAGECGKVVMLPVENLANLANFRAALYSSWLGSGRIISRDKLARLFGVSRQTQRRYESLAGIEVRPVFGEGPARTLEDSPARLGQYPDAGRTWLGYRGGVLSEVWRLPNAYESRLGYGQLGMTLRVNRGLRALSRDKGEGKRRVFFNDVKKLLRRARGEGGYHLVGRSRVGLRYGFQPAM